MSHYNLYIIPSHPFTKIPYDTLHETLVYLKTIIQYLEKIRHSPITLIHQHI